MSSSGEHRPKDGADITECVNQCKTYSKNQGAINEGGREVTHLGWGQAGWKEHAPAIPRYALFILYLSAALAFSTDCDSVVTRSRAED